MLLIFLFTVVFSFVIISLVRHRRTAEIPYKRPIRSASAHKRKHSIKEPQTSSMTNPFIVFNKTDMNNIVFIKAGSIITENVYILTGEVGVYLNVKRKVTDRAPAIIQGYDVPRVPGDKNTFQNIKNTFEEVERVPITVLKKGDIT
ncbi:hypothetical protein PAEPH01_2766, partial [Pancytospora epiphaga]